jgi:hypothetical protein
LGSGRFQSQWVSTGKVPDILHWNSASGDRSRTFSKL